MRFFAARRGPGGRRRPWLFSRIGARILAFNLLLVFIPVVSFLLLDTYERSLVASLESSLVQQARIIAAWLGEGELDMASAERALGAIGGERTARFRVVDAQGRLLADTAYLLRAAATASEEAPGGGMDLDSDLPVDPAGSVLYRILSAPIRAYRRHLAPPTPALESADVYGSAEVLTGPEVAAALAGRYGATTRISSGGQTSVTLYSALPIRREGRVRGAVLASQSTYRILRELYALRLDAGRIFLWSAAVAGLISLLLSLSIVSPVERLRRAAVAALDARSGTAAYFPETDRKDEIGELSTSLRGFALRLDERLKESERFAADLAHEFKNPLAAIRSSAELLEEAGDEEERRRFSRAIGAEVERLRGLVDGLRRLARAEAGSPIGEIETLRLGPAVEAAWLRSGAAVGKCSLSFTLESALGEGDELSIEASRLEALLDNLLGNAASFARSMVRVRIGGAKNAFAIEVEDDGPGIPPEHLGRVFDRFFSWRPGTERSGHTGLGLALVRSLVESEGGAVSVENRSEGGARFRVLLPRRPDNTPPSP